MDFWISDWISGFHSGFLDFWISVWISADGGDFTRDSLCSPILRSGTCAVHYVMLCKRERLSVVGTIHVAMWGHRQGEIEIYVKLDQSALQSDI